jgi:hypothetical protein
MQRETLSLTHELLAGRRFDGAYIYENVRVRVQRYVLVPLLFPFVCSDFRCYLRFPDCGS